MKKDNISNKVVSLVIILLVLIVFIAVNTLSGMLADNFNLKVDLTRAKLLEFSPLTTELINKIETDDAIQDDSIRIISIIPDKFKESSDPYDVIDSTYSIIEKFASSTGKISFEKIDPKSDPGIYERFKKDSGENMEDISIIVSYKDKYRILGSADMANLYNDNLLLLKAEQSLSSAIDYAVYGKKLNIYVTTGHGENITASHIIESFPLLHADIASLNLTNASVPENADLLIINPSDDFTPSEITEIDKYMNTGGNAIVVYDGHNTAKELPNIKEYFREWGIEYIDGYVIEESQSNYADNPLQLLPDIYNHDIVNSIKTAERRIISTEATAIKNSNAKNITVTPLLITSDQSFVTTNTDGTGNHIANGPFSVASACQKPLDNGKKADMIFIGGKKLLDSEFIVNSAFANADFISNCIKYTTGSSTLLEVGPKDITAQGMDISAEQSENVMIITVIVIPAALLIIGLVVWIRRRKL